MTVKKKPTQRKLITGKDGVPEMPNGFNSWQQTFFEMSTFVIHSLKEIEQGYKGKRYNVCVEIEDTLNNQGMIGIYTLVQMWTDEFEKTHIDWNWDQNDFWETIDKFIKSKNIKHG